MCVCVYVCVCVLYIICGPSLLIWELSVSRASLSYCTFYQSKCFTAVLLLLTRCWHAALRMVCLSRSSLSCCTFFQIKVSLSHTHTLSLILSLSLSHSLSLSLSLPPSLSRRRLSHSSLSCCTFFQSECFTAVLLLLTRCWHALLSRFLLVYLHLNYRSCFNTHTHTHTRTNTNTHSNTCTHTNTYTHSLARSLSPSH